MSTLPTKFGILLSLLGGYLASAGEISDLYYKQTREGTNSASEYMRATRKSRSFQEITSTNHAITEIGIERTGCYGTCPAYTFIAKSDGIFHYRGYAYTERLGQFSGRISVWQFHALAKFVRDAGYMSLENEYRVPVTDNPTTFTTVVMNGNRKVISNYADAGPTVLWAIEELIDDLMAKAEWKTSHKPPEPVLPKTTRYDSDPVLRAVYLDSFKKGYFDGWDGKYELPVFAPTSDADKARVLAYPEGLKAGRAAVAKWYGTNSPPTAAGTSGRK